MQELTQARYSKAADKMTSKIAKRKRLLKINVCCGRCCPAFCAFLFMVLVFIPLIVFTLSAIFALILKLLECPHYEEADVNETGDLCSWYQWFCA